jgi:hypothetical protein
LYIQTDNKTYHRAVLVDWLIEIHNVFGHEPTTLYLCVNLIDRFCAANIVPSSQLQLLGVTAMLIACKFEEMNIVGGALSRMERWLRATHNTLTRQEIVDFEAKVLTFFEFNVSSPTCHQFVVTLLQMNGDCPKSRTAHRAAYFSERCLQEHDMLAFAPSLIAASAVFLATGGTSWVSLPTSCAPQQQ